MDVLCTLSSPLSRNRGNPCEAESYPMLRGSHGNNPVNMGPKCDSITKQSQLYIYIYIHIYIVYVYAYIYIKRTDLYPSIQYVLNVN